MKTNLKNRILMFLGMALIALPNFAQGLLIQKKDGTQIRVPYEELDRMTVYEKELPAEGKYANGTFVLSEGNMSDQTGHLAFIDANGVLTDSVYFKENGSFLGAASQDLFIANGKIYIISQNGTANGGDGLLVVADAQTLKKEAVYNDELVGMATTWPSHIAVVNNEAYIRDNNGINLFDLNTKTLKFVEGTDRAAKNRMAVIGDKVYAIVGNNVVVIQHGNVVAKIAMPGSISGVQRSFDNNLWVSCTTSPAKMCKVNVEDNSIMQTNEIAESGIGAGWGATPGFSAKGDTIYFSNASTKIYRHIFNEKKTEFMTDVKSHVADASMAYNNLAVHPETGEVYFTSIKGYGNLYKVNDITVFNFSKEPVLKADYKGAAIFPAGVFFTASFK